jgi:lysozyme
MQLSEDGVQLLRELEGVEYEPYHDSAGLLTVGVGHCLTKDELSSGKILCGDRVIRWKDGPLSDEEINALLAEDVGWAEAAVETAVHVQLTQNQYDALVCLAYNIGPNAFRQSTLCRILNQHDYASVPAQMARWCHAGGQVVQGLVTRRVREIALWQAG